MIHVRRCAPLALGVVGAVAAIAILATGSGSGSQTARGADDVTVHRPATIFARPVAQLQEPPAEDQPLPVPEGPAFDRDGDLYYVTVYGYQGHSLFKYDLDSEEITPIQVTHADDPDYSPGFVALAIHKNGQIYAADFPNEKIVSIDPDTHVATDVLTRENVGTPMFAPDDLVFDSKGNLYITDLQGDIADKRGRVYRLSANGELTVLLDDLAAPNGVALSPDEHQLWVSEYHQNRLIRIDVDEGGGIVDAGFADLIEIISNFQGPGLADSSTTDAAGNYYQAFYRGSRVQVLSPHGAPRADVVLKSDSDDYLQTTNVAIEPGTRRAFLTAGGPGGARLYEFTALENGWIPYSHQ